MTQTEINYGKGKIESMIINLLRNATNMNIEEWNNTAVAIIKLKFLLISQEWYK